jgi:hypothetical protein
VDEKLRKLARDAQIDPAARDVYHRALLRGGQKLPVKALRSQMWAFGYRVDVLHKDADPEHFFCPNDPYLIAYRTAMETSNLTGHVSQIKTECHYYRARSGIGGSIIWFCAHKHKTMRLAWECAKRHYYAQQVKAVLAQPDGRAT